MNFYVYKGKAPLGSEPLGSGDKSIWKDLKSTQGALNRAKKYWGDNFSLYTFTNFYDPKTFRKVYGGAGEAMEDGIRSYGPGKFYTILDTYVYDIVMNGFSDAEASFGDGNGAYALVKIDDDTVAAVAEAAKENKDELTRDELEQLVGHRGGGVIFFERSDGIVESEWFDSSDVKRMDKVWEDIEEDTAQGDEDE